ncbi:NAD(P)-binding protein [Thozetella sp. PMI_491]|nr:NAD(P)-binding protein [Thozetella sp. PMI_491]
MDSTRLIAVIGGTGAQGIPVIRDLVQSGKYKVRALTRDASSPRFQELQSYGPVEPIIGTFASDDDLRATFRGAWGAFVNIDGFNSGEKTEMYWAIRSYELALEEGVSMFVYGNLDYVYKKSGFKPEFRSGHYDGKGRIGEWVLFQNQTNSERMKTAVFTTGPYLEMAIAAGAAMTPTVEDGIVTWRLPLGDGAVAHVALEDCGYYVKWLFDHPERANGLDLEVAIAHLTYHEIASAFEKVTGHKAQFINRTFDEHFGPMGPMGEKPAGYNADPKDPATMSLRKNFEGFWTMWQHSGGNTGVIKRDYALLDEIHPNRIRSAEDWFRHEEQRGIAKGLGSLWDRVQPANQKPILKLAEDKRQGRL